MNEMGQPAIVEPAPVRSPQRLAESYNPSIGLAGGSSQIARPGKGNLVRCRCWRPKMSDRETGYDDKTAHALGLCCKNTAVLCLRHLAGYHPISSFAVQLSIHDAADGRGSLVR
jgi:hypothetical protein